MIITKLDILNPLKLQDEEENDLMMDETEETKEDKTSDPEEGLDDLSKELEEE